MRSWFAVLNPAAGAGRGTRDRVGIVNALRAAGLAFELAASERPGHAAELVTEAVAQGYRKFLAIGGDGTLNQVVHGALCNAGTEQSFIVGLLPVGRGNDWARTHRIPRRYDDAAQLLARERVAPHDVGVAESFSPEGAQLRYFLNVAGVGFDAHIVARTAHARWGALTYLAALPAGFASYRPQPLTIVVDGYKTSGEVFVAFAALGRFCGGGMHVAPQAATDDGLFDVVIIEALSGWELVRNLRRLFDGTIERHPKVKVLRGRVVDIAGPRPVLSQADGELLSPSPIRFSVLPHGIRMVVP